MQKLGLWVDKVEDIRGCSKQAVVPTGMCEDQVSGGQAGKGRDKAAVGLCEIRGW